MEMTIEEAVTRYKNNAEYERTHGNLQGCLEFRQLAEWLRKYQQLQADYENRLKADMVAMLEEISLEIDEMDCTIDHDFEGYYTGHVDCKKLIREKINSLKEDT